MGADFFFGVIIVLFAFFYVFGSEKKTKINELSTNSLSSFTRANFKKEYGIVMLHSDSLKCY
jgi:hypothetical protein